MFVIFLSSLERFFVPLLVDFIIRIARTKHIYNFFESYNLHTYCSDLIESRQLFSLLFVECNYYRCFYQAQTALTQVLYEFSQLFNKEKRCGGRERKKELRLVEKRTSCQIAKQKRESAASPTRLTWGGEKVPYIIRGME